MARAKVFGIGLSRTGTVSLSAALTRLGYSTKHYPHLLKIVELSRQYDALTDSPVAPYAEVLDRLYPDAKFILTVRDVADWLESCRRHWARRAIADIRPGWKLWNRRANYGMETYDAEAFARSYHAHASRVCAYFEGRPGQLLILDICGGEGYERLCPFLGLPVIDEPFPHLNVGVGH